MMGAAVEIFNGDNAQARKALVKLFEFIAGEHIIFPALRTPRHDEMILAPSPNVRPKGWEDNLGTENARENLVPALLLTFFRTGEGDRTRQPNPQVVLAKLTRYEFRQQPRG